MIQNNSRIAILQFHQYSLVLDVSVIKKKSTERGIGSPSFTRAPLASTFLGYSKQAFMATVAARVGNYPPYITLFGNPILCLLPPPTTRTRG